MAPMMTTGPAAQSAPPGDIMEAVLIKGDLAKLSEIERVNYYNAVCKSIGLNPLTRPFDYITLNGKLQLYAKRDACDQLRKIYSISLEITSAKINDDGIYTVEVRAKTPDGRQDMDVGAVYLADSVKADLRANLILKCVTKAKRRATLSICGLGFLDETEVEDIPTSAPERPALKSSSQFEELDDDEQTEAHETASEEIERLDRELGVAAEGGTAILATAWKLVPREHQPALKAALDRRHKPRAQKVDEAKK